MKYTPTIGLEVHAELKTKSKMFCGCKNEPHAAEPNANTCPICLAHPGTLPVPNESAIEMVLLFGNAVGATKATYSEFDRKNYFYPDIPKAYQISQYAFPFLTGGSLKDVDLTRVHLEEDTARSAHDKGEGSLVDFNRAGVPLMELVTEPVIHDAKTAGDFARELQLLLRTLHISDANMEKGEMRVEANISISADPATLGTKVEVKNLNSFKSVEAAILFEIERQTLALETGELLVQETRGWDEVNLKTFSQRSKETAKDYRYFPDPDLPKMQVMEHFTETRLSEIMPKLPNEIRKTYRDIGLSLDTAELIMSDQSTLTFFTQLTDLTEDKDLLKMAANYLTSDMAAVLETENCSLEDISSAYFVELMKLVLENKINSRTAKDLLKDLKIGSKSPLEIVEERGLLQVSDEAALKAMMLEVIAANASVADEYRSGKEAAANFLVGQGMKQSKGTANPELLRAIIAELLQS